jgi:uncharacterized protein
MLKIKNKIIYSWSDVQGLVEEICKRIPEITPSISSVHGIKRGGLIPAVMISHKLGIPYTDVVYGDTLVIDDICDTGETLIGQIGVYTAVLVYKPNTSKFQPNIWGNIQEGDEYIVFPWESINAKPIAGYLDKS